MPAPDRHQPASTLVALRDVIDRYSRGTHEAHGLHGLALRASIAKAFEFADFCWHDPPPRNPFFATAILRGICEDYIAFSFLQPLEARYRDQAIELLMNLKAHEALSAQVNFFNAQRPWQPIVHPGTSPVQQVKDHLYLITRMRGWQGTDPWPSVWFMAQLAGLRDLYLFLYSATSKWVHFDPHVLLRMGWGGGPDTAPGHATEWHFSTAHFQPYYTSFNRTYALFLLVNFARSCAQELAGDENARPLLDALESYLEGKLRWPELVTHEELNLEPPHAILRILMLAGRRTTP